MLERQETESAFGYSIVIVDNDASESARHIVESFARQSKICISYYVEREQNIALARNVAVENAGGNLIALIDDDEVPGERWLLSLYRAINSYGCDGILGPVLPRFEKEPPGWVKKGGFFLRQVHCTGHILEWENTRTGNALIKREMFGDDRRWFDPAFGSGGEDREFFRRKIEQGFVLVWCNEAPVYEIVPSARWKRTVLLKRALLRGKVTLHASEQKAMSIFVSTIAVVIYSSALPVLLLLGHHRFMKYLIKDFDHLGKILAYLNIDLVREKYVGG